MAESNGDSITRTRKAPTVQFKILEEIPTGSEDERAYAPRAEVSVTAIGDAKRESLAKQQFVGGLEEDERKALGPIVAVPADSWHPTRLKPKPTEFDLEDA
jgi:hypothetical protein